MSPQLSAHENRLSDQWLQFLLDASLGLINVEQNNIFKVLTIVYGDRHPPHSHRQHVRHEFQEHSQIHRLGLGL